MAARLREGRPGSGQGQAERDRVSVAERLASAGTTDVAPADGYAVRQRPGDHAEHLLVVRANDTADLDRWLNGRIYTPVFLDESQGLEVYRVYPKP